MAWQEVGIMVKALFVSKFGRKLAGERSALFRPFKRSDAEHVTKGVGLYEYEHGNSSIEQCFRTDRLCTIGHLHKTWCKSQLRHDVAVFRGWARLSR